MLEVQIDWPESAHAGILVGPQIDAGTTTLTGGTEDSDRVVVLDELIDGFDVDWHVAFTLNAWTRSTPRRYTRSVILMLECPSNFWASSGVAHLVAHSARRS